jgi:hypothetical protein
MMSWRFVFPLDRAAVMTTRFMMPAAKGMPAAAKANTNGLPDEPKPGEDECHDGGDFDESKPVFEYGIPNNNRDDSTEHGPNS